MIKRILVVMGMVILFGGGYTWQAEAQVTSDVTFGETLIENNFPDGTTFETVVSSPNDEIVSAKILTGAPRSTSTNQVVIDIEPGNEVSLVYEWDTTDVTTPPSMPVLYRWEVKLASGDFVQSDEMLYRYDDIRFDWQVKENEAIAVWWYDRPASFGEQVFAIAERSVNEQKELFGVEIEDQLRIIIYNDFEAFETWHTFVNDFIGGQAFSSMGITTQIVEGSRPSESWLNNVIPHEVAHLYFFQVTYHPLSSPPAWLNEGLAQYLEFSDNSVVLRRVETEILNGERIPLWSLTGSFGNEEASVRQSYAQGLSAVTYLVEAYGAEGLSAVLANYEAGMGDERAFEEALGITPIEFEYEWLAWLGAPPDLYPTPTMLPTQAPVPTFAMMMPPTRRATETPTATPGPEATAEAALQATALAMVAETRAGEEVTAVVTETVVEDEEPVEEESNSLGWVIGLAVAFIGVVGGVAIWVLALSKRKG